MSPFDEAPEHEWIVHRILEHNADLYPDFPFLHYEGNDYSHKQMNQRANRLARGIASLDLQFGDRVAVMMKNSPEYIDVWFALAKLGAVEVPLNTAYKGEILTHMLQNSGANIAVLDEEFLPIFADILDRCVNLKKCIIHYDNSLTENVTIPIQKHSLSGLPRGSENNLNKKIFPETLACIMFTSGTTGPSKGVMLNHQFEISFSIVFNEIVSLQKDDISYNFLPFFHIAGKFILLGTLLVGGRMILRERLSIENFWPDVRRYGATVTVAVGGICQMLYSAERQQDDAENSLRMIYSVPNPHEVQEEFKQRFDLELTEGYGSTEANIVIYSRPDESTPIGSCGRVAPYYEVKIVDPAGRQCPSGEAGEFAIRPKYPNTLMSGYYGMEEKSLEAFKDLWFHSGDRGYQDSNGYFYFLDRLKDAIRRRGENISSFEVERILNMHKDISESAAIAVPAKLGEDEVKAIIVCNPGAKLNPVKLLEYCVEQMPYFMVPRYFEFKPSLPRTPTQKVRKIELRNEGITDNTWDCETSGLRVTRRGLTKIT